MIGGDVRVVPSVPGHRNAVNGVQFSADGRYLVSTSEDGTIKVWESSKPDDP